MYKDMEPEILLTIPPSGAIARCVNYTKLEETISVFAGSNKALSTLVDITKVRTEKVIGLLEYQEGTMYLVSKMVIEAVPERADLLIMHGLYKQGNITLGCRSFSQG